MLVRLLFLVHRSVNGCVSSDFQGIGRRLLEVDRPTFSGKGGKQMSSQNKKILVVDDQYGIRVLLKEVFSKDDFCVYQAENGQVALDLIQKIRPDLILLDMKMPGMDGIEFLRRLQDIPPMPKVIMMTAYGELDMVQEATKLGALAHLTKPFDIVELRSEVLKQLAS
jgi:two-component system response regulator (stage 0 sporulation protein F)